MSKDQAGNNRFISFDVEYKDGAISKIKGSYSHNLSFYRFSLKRQNTTMPMMRGTVSAIDKTGRVLKYVYVPKAKNGEKTESKTKVLSNTVRCYSFDEDDIKNSIEDTIIRMYGKNARYIESERDLAIRPDTITPAIAAQSYSGRYVAFSHPDGGEKYQRNLEKKIQNCCAKLPNKAMATISKKEMKTWMHEQMASRDMHRLLSGFWDYCINKRICFGTNPVAIPPRSAKKDKLPKKSGYRIDCLEPDQQDIIYDILEIECSGSDCGIALMLGGGFDPKDIVKFNWDRLEFRGDDYAIIKYMQTEYVGATHNYSKPLSPRAAVILHKRFDYLCSTRDIKKVISMPIACQKKNSKIPMTTDHLIKNATDLLLNNCINYETYKRLSNEDLDIAAATRIMRNSYTENLKTRCLLAKDPGALDFLLGKSLAQDITSDAYTDFTSDDGFDRLYAIQKVLCKKEPIPEIPDYIDKDGRFVHTLTAKNTRSYYVAIIEAIVNPGEELEISCPHGVTGSGDVRAFTKTGRRRKVSKE